MNLSFIEFIYILLGCFYGFIVATAIYKTIKLEILGEEAMKKYD